MVSEAVDAAAYPSAAFLLVPNTLAALQSIAANHRSRFDIPVIGITGSNGKTVVKEWLYQLLHKDYRIVRSPKSYNSQLGVPLSVWNMKEVDTLAIFEAGISQPGEMDRLENIIRPDIGVLTNIGEAHNEGFSGKDQKRDEKLKLFSNSQLLIGREADLQNKATGLNGTIITWGTGASNDLQVKHIERKEDHTVINLCTGSMEKPVSIPFTDEASIENAITCYLVMLQLGYEHDTIAGRMQQLQPVDMRMVLKKGINHCRIINDSYSADIHSLEMALNFLDQQSGSTRKTVILSDFLESAQNDESLYTYILHDLRKHKVSRLIGIGEHISKALRQWVNTADAPVVELFASTESYLQQFLSSQFRDETILVKGARVFGFERIVHLLELKVHQTVLEINLNAIVHNVKAYQQNLGPQTKIMAMVKAFAYGSGGAEIAGVLQYHKVDYLGVAYADEGVELRKAGITLPVMVMNPGESAFESLVEYNLEPDLYSFRLFRSFNNFLEKEGLHNYPVHIEIETGMNRLGFSVEETAALSQLIASSSVKVQSVFSHLACSDDPTQDAFTLEQFGRYRQAVENLKKHISYDFTRHISNTGAIFRLPELQLDMVRLGIGMYGIDSAGGHQTRLQPVATLRSTIAQLKHVKKGESVSYNRRGVVKRDSLIATVRIGYADGYPRRLGNGVGHMLVRNMPAPVMGTVCMDMTMIDVTDIPGVEEGDEVIVFGQYLPVQQLAEWADTIPYEIMTGISQRVKRVYFEE